MEGLQVINLNTPLEINSNPSKQLWFAVLRQALEDAFTYSGANIAMYERQAARDFVRKRNKDFDIVCENAGFNPEYVWIKVNQYKEKSYVWQNYLRSVRIPYEQAGDEQWADCDKCNNQGEIGDTGIVKENKDEQSKTSK